MMLRKTPLSHGSKPLQRFAALVAKTPLARRSSGRVRHRNTGPDHTIVGLVLKRAYDDAAGCLLCEKCSAELAGKRGVGWHLHHRRPRRIGGSRLPDTNSPANLLALCPDCHSTVESYRVDSYAHGWLLHAGDIPAAEPVLLYRGSRWTYLSDNGLYVDQPPKPAVA